MSSLSTLQKKILARLARRAFNLTGAKALGAGDAWDGSGAAFDVWRHDQVATASGKAGLRACSQLDYKRVEAHFQSLLGQDGRALNAHVRAETEPRRQAEAKLLEVCEQWGFHLDYASSLSLRIHKVNLFDADTAVIWKLIYTINNRGRAKAAKGVSV